MVIPPAGPACFWMEAGQVGVAGERVAHQDGIVARRGKFPQRLVGDIDVGEFVPGLGAHPRQTDTLGLRHTQGGMVAGHLLVLEIAGRRLRGLGHAGYRVACCNA